MHGVFDVVFSSTTACIHASIHPQERCIFLSFSPSPTYLFPSGLLYPYPPHPHPLPRFVLPRFPSCGSNSLYFRNALRSPSVASHTNLFHKSTLVPYLLFARFHCSVLCAFLVLARSSRRFCPSSEFFFSIFPTHLIFDTSLQVVSKNAQLNLQTHGVH